VPEVELAVFWGCRAISGDIAFELSVRRLAEALGVRLVDLEGQSCCGEPLRSVSIPASCYLAIRMMALAAREGHKMLLVPCPKGYYMMSWSRELMSNSAELREHLSKALESEGLDISKLAEPIDLIGLLHDLVGPEALSRAVKRDLGLRVAVHPGCYLLRSGGGAAERLSQLRTVLGAVGLEVPYYPGMLDCCGCSLEVSRPDAALTLAGSKLKAAQEAGLSCLVVSCPACFHMLDGRQEEALAAVGVKKPMPVLYLSQVLGLALGLEPDEVGLNLNSSPTEELGIGI